MLQLRTSWWRCLQSRRCRWRLCGCGDETFLRVFGCSGNDADVDVHVFELTATVNANTLVVFQGRGSIENRHRASLRHRLITIHGKDDVKLISKPHLAVQTGRHEAIQPSAQTFAISHTQRLADPNNKINAAHVTCSGSSRAGMATCPRPWLRFTVSSTLRCRLSMPSSCGCNS